MVLALNTIWNEGGFHIQVENYRDRYHLTIPPEQTASYIGARWIDKGKGKTVITILEAPSMENDSRPIDPDENGEGGGEGERRRSAVVSLEDINWQLVLMGDVQGKSYSIPVNGNKDFDLVVRKDGTISVRCLGGSFMNGVIEAVIEIPPLQLSNPLPTGETCTPRLFDPSIETKPSSNIRSCDQDPSSARHVVRSDLQPPPHRSQPIPNQSLVASSYSISEISPDLLKLLDELRADQRRILQREFQMVGAGFAERLLNGGRRLMGVSEPQEFLPLTALINLLVLPSILLVLYFYNTRRQPTTFTTLFFSPYDRARKRMSRARGRAVSVTAVSRNGPSGVGEEREWEPAPPPLMVDSLLETVLGSNAEREGIGEDEQCLPPPYPWEERWSGYLS